MRPVKCIYCEQMIDRTTEKYAQVQKRYAHDACLENQERDKKVRRDLNDFIYTIWENDINFGVIGQQIKTFQSQYKYTLSGILGTLHYCYNIKKLDPKKAQGIGIVPFYYKEARSYFENIEKGKINSSELSDIKRVSVNISPPVSKPMIKIHEIKLEEV